ncbi:MAG: STAS domain-containing protein [Thermoguttaceae bacterium]
MPSIKSKSDGEKLIIYIDEKHLDTKTIQQFYKEVLSVLDKTQEPVVVLDFRRVTVMSSAALGILIRLWKRCKESGIRLRLSHVSASILHVFKTTGLDNII